MRNRLALRGADVEPSLPWSTGMKTPGSAQGLDTSIVVTRSTGTKMVIRVPDAGADVEAVERALITFALQRTAGNRTHAARLLGLSRSALLYRMHKHALAILPLLVTFIALTGRASFAQVAPSPTAGIARSFTQAAPLAEAASTLNRLVSELDRNNPALNASRREVDMRVARIAPAGAPPDPSLTFGYMGGLLRPPFFPSAETPNGFRQFGASQEIPFPGKLGLRSRVAVTEADTARWNVEDVRLRLIADLKTSYFDLVLADRSLAIVTQTRQLLQQVRDVAEARFRVGKGLQQDVLKSQLELSMLLERAAMLEQQRAAAQARVNALLYRRQDTPVDVQPTFSTALLPATVEPLRATAVERYPGLRRDEQLIQRGQQGLALARKEVLPDFGVNVAMQQPVPGMPWMYGVDFMVRVPIFWQRKQRPMIAEAAAALDAGRRTRENTLAQTQGAVTENYLMATTANRLMTLYSDSILPQARLTLESSLASYRVGSVDFLTVLTNVTTILAYELNYEQQQAQYRQALAQLEPYVGTTLIR